MNIFEDEYEEHFSDDLSQAEKAVLHLNLPYNVRKNSKILFMQRECLVSLQYP